MARMKGNHGGDGNRSPGFDLAPVRTPRRAVPRADRPMSAFPWGLLLTVGLGAIVGVLIFAAFWSVRGHGNNPAIEEAEGPAAVATAPASPTATTGAAAVSASPPQTAPARPSPATVTATLPTTAAQATPSATSVRATPAPVGPPTTRQRYVVQGGDACDLIRQALRFPAADFQNFQTAVTRLTGRADACSLRAGNVLCLPATSDLVLLAALVKDEACLKAP